MCGIFCSLTSRDHLRPSKEIQERLKCRGPDSDCTLTLESGTPSCNVTLCSTVLSLRGSDVTSQPCQSLERRYVLCWNGEAWSIDNESGIEDDTTAIHKLLCQTLGKISESARQPSGIDTAEALASTLSRVAGPYAFVFLDRERGHLYFGRDFLGRRSLCWRTSFHDELIICSVTDGVSAHGWQEVEADGVYFIDINSFSGASHPANGTNDETQDMRLSNTAPYKFIDEGSSVIPRLSLNKDLLPHARSLSDSSPAVARLHALLRDSLSLRVQNVPDPPTITVQFGTTKFAVLFSGGLDCTILSRICHDLLPASESIDLLNVAFENPRIHSKVEGGADAAYELCPDRVTGRASFAELQATCRDRTFRFVAVNVPYSETLQHRETVVSLMHPHNTEMDLSIASALYFAARGIGVIESTDNYNSSAYTTPARVLLSGLGADELFGGYTRHATAFERRGFQGLIDELELDVSRLGKRNLGRDDRVICHWGKEARFPFLDEVLLAWALNAPVTDKCGFGESTEDGAKSAALEPGKKVLRCLACKLGMAGVAKEKKRAIQFGARTAKMETGKTKGTTLLS